MENPRLKYLDDVPWEKLLRLSSGKVVHNLEQLPLVVQFSDDEVFFSHVTGGKNDFSSWIKDVIGYPELAEKIFNIHDKEEFVRVINDSITDIKNYVPSAAPVSSSVAPSNSAPSVVAPNVLPVTPQIVSPTPVPVAVPSNVAVPVITPAVPDAVVPVTVVPVIAPAVPDVAVQSNPVDAKLRDQASTTPVASSAVTASSAVSVPTVSVAPSIVPSVASAVVPQVIPSIPNAAAVPLTPNVSAVPTASAIVPDAPVAAVSPAVVVSPVAATSPVTATSPAAPVSPAIAESPAAVKPDISPETLYDFEEIFKALLDDMANEIFVWDAQTS